MTPTQIKRWFAAQSAITQTTITESRKSLNLTTASNLRPLRTVSLDKFSVLSGIGRGMLHLLETAKRNWTTDYVAKYLAGVAKQKGAGR